MFNLFTALSSAFGLSSAAGLNAYIPLLLVSIMAKTGTLHLAPPYDHLSSWWCIILLALLCIIELVVDKIPGADHINNIIQTLIRPTAGAILFASQAGIIHHIHPAVWIILGLLMAGSVHAAKSLTRPVVNVPTLGLGAPILSSLENILATTLTLLAILAPIFVLFFMAFCAWLLYKVFKRFRSRARPIPVLATPVPQ